MASQGDELVAGYGHLVGREAARYRTWRLDRDDLHQAGMLGLLVATARFDPDRGVPFVAYAQIWVRKEIQRAIAQQEFPSALPPDLTGRAVVLHSVLGDHSGDVDLTAAALGVSRATIVALYRQLRIAEFTADEEEEMVAPGYLLPGPEEVTMLKATTAVARASLARMDRRQAAAFVLRYGLDGGNERSLRDIARQLGVSGHTARLMVERAQRVLRQAIGG